MKSQLRERRDRAAERHDAALAKYPAREGELFQSELRAVVDELSIVAKTADDPSSDPVEVAKTYRWLGDAYFDLARGTAEEPLTEGAKAYQRAEELLAESDAPVEKAKLDFNYGNTLRGLSQGSDVGLLEAAQTRYERAAHTFQLHHLPDLATTVQEQLRSIDPQLRLARMQSSMRRGFGRLEELTEALKAAGPVERERIAKELQELKKLPGRGDAAEALTEAVKAIREQAEQHPERFGEDASKIESLRDQVERLGSLLQGASSAEAPRGTAEGWEQEVARALAKRLQTEVATGSVSPDRAAQLSGILKDFTEAMSSGGDDLESMAVRSQKMRELSQQVMDAAMEPSWSTPSPPSGSRAHNAAVILTTLKRYLLAEKGRAMLPPEESTAATDLLMRLMKLEARIREGADDDERVSGLEGEVWHLALAVQEYARRYHLMLAQPDFAMAKVHAKPKSLFLSGGEVLLAAAKERSAREEIELFERPTYGDTAQERWNQLSSASVGVFDIGVPEGAEQAQVCYELGLALALGKPSVVTTRPRRRLPFDVNLQPINLSEDRMADADALGKAIQDALGSNIWGGAEAGLGAGPREALTWLHRHFQGQLSAGQLHVAMELAEKAQGDAVAFRTALEQLLGMLGADAPAILLAAWPAAYPDPTEGSRCFHVMPFGAPWSTPTRDLAAAVCRKKGWTYTRGDEAGAQRIIRGIWDEIGRASAVLVDITGHNANVALELGLVHALGRPYYLVAQDDPKKHMFPSIAKVQVHSYDSRPPFAGFEGHVEGLLSLKRQNRQ